MLDLCMVVFGKIIAVGSLFACSVFSARGLGPAGYGILAAALSFVLLLDALLGAPLDLATIRYGALYRQQPGRTLAIQIAFLRIKFILGSALAVVAWATHAALSQFALPGATLEVWLLVALNILLLLLLRGYAAMLQSLQDFGGYSALDAVQGVLRLAAIVPLSLLFVGTPGAYLAMYALAATAALAFANKKVALPDCWTPWPPRADMQEALRYVGLTGTIGVLGTITGRSDMAMVATQGDATSTAYYGVAAQFALLVTMVASYASIVIQPRILELSRSGQLRKLVLANVVCSLLGAALLYAAQFSFLPMLVQRFFGAEFLPSLVILKYLLWGACIDSLLLPILVPYALQLHVRQCLLAECLFVTVYAATLPFALTQNATGIAMLVTAIRAAKLVFYGGLWWRTQAAHAHEAPAPG